MAPITKTLALAGAFFAMTGYSAPVAKRAVVWETVTDIVWTTVDVTTTVYPQAIQTATVVPMVANAVPTTTPAPAVEAPVKEQEKVAPTTSATTSATTTAAAVPIVEEKAAPTTSSTTTAAPAAPTVEAEPYSAPAPAPAPVVEAETSSAAAPAAPAATPAVNTETANTETTTKSTRTGVCSEGAPCTGEITFYDTATTSTNPSSCGTTNDGTVENVLALPHGIMADSDCGKTVTVTYNGQTATGIVVDKCMGCDNGSVDLSRHFFGELAPMGKGRASGAKWFIH
ncbi:hypothetical protein PENFLA_c005G03502 [Penicillium flavigenum]|uniref:RlpA-like protein double-psi beta-barrel domain-containing protein n=1 Tax=Penicillium flavigenum TaxID=254877 RepID=A0A1V6TPZ0_9EURO|nr:hypothetical protein PENFLA_c005G03502 [Penicillium flavigenum]